MSVLENVRTETVDPELFKLSDVESFFRLNAKQELTTAQTVCVDIEEAQPLTTWTAPHRYDIEVKFLSVGQSYFAKLLSRETASFSYIVFGAESTKPQRTDPESVNHAICRICREASDYQFEDGMNSPFEVELRKLVFLHEIMALEALHAFIEHGNSNTIAAEALRIIGAINAPSIHPYRKWLLQKYLQHRSPYIRDGAIVGLLYLDDPATLPRVEAAIETETSSLLKEDLQQLSDQLKATQNATTQVRS